MDDFGLLERWRGGDAAAGNELFERHFDALYRFFDHKANLDAADLVQRCFLVCVESRDRFRNEASFRTFLFGIAKNELYAYWRRQKRASAVDPATSSLEDLSPSPTSNLARHDDQRRLLLALRSIPLELQITIELHFWEQLTGPELARVLEVPEGTVRSRLRRGLEALRDKLGKLEPSRGAPHGPDDLALWASALERLRVSDAG